MQTKKFVALLFIVVLFTSTRSFVHAVFVDISDTGTVSFYNNSVLGDDDKSPEVEREVEVERKEERKVEEHKNETPSDVVRNEKREQERMEVRLEPISKDATRVEVKKIDDRSGKSKVVREREENRVEVQFEDKEGQVRDARRQYESELEQAKQQFANSKDPNKKALFEAKKKELEAKLEEKKQAIEQAQIPRPQNEQEFHAEEENRPLEKPDKVEREKNRKENVAKLQDAVRENKREIQLKAANGVVARFAQGAQIAVDAETGAVTLTTPNGKEKVLNNFPDDVLERLKEKKNFEFQNKSEIETKVDDQGDIVHVVKNVEQERKLLWIFNRKVTGEAMVDDATGEVEFKSGDSGFFSNLLNSMSR